jgi:signal transduction histidine kinase
MIKRDPFNTILKAYRSAEPLEQKRLVYAVLVEIGMLVLFVGLTIIHYVFGMHAVHYIGDLGAIACLLTSMYLLRHGREKEAGSLVIWGLVGIIFVYGVLVDRCAAAHIEFLRLYVTLFSILGVYILIISIYKTFHRFFWIALIFNVIATLHMLTIVDHNGGGMSGMTAENWAYFCAAIVTINVAAFVTYITSLYNKELTAENKLNIDKINQHNLNLNQLVDRQTSELKESNERLRSFAHIASHDLKEPLRSISGFVTLIEMHLRKNYPDDRALNEYIHFVTTGTKRMGTLITDILSFSKLDTRKKDFEPVDLNEVVAHVLNHLDTIIHSRRAIIEYSGLPVIKGQANLIAQVFLNLISNAIKYSRPDEIPHISIQSVRKHNSIEIAIRDNGIGMDSDTMAQIFKPYYWQNTETPEESTGMGLAICRKIIEFHDGLIWVESTAGEGSVFYCSFPVMPEKG